MKPQMSLPQCLGEAFGLSFSVTNYGTTDGRRGRWHLLKAGVNFTAPLPMSLHSFANTTTTCLTWLTKPYFQWDGGTRRSIGVPQELLHFCLLLLSPASFLLHSFTLLTRSSLPPRCCFYLRVFSGCYLSGWFYFWLFYARCFRDSVLTAALSYVLRLS